MYVCVIYKNLLPTVFGYECYDRYNKILGGKFKNFYCWENTVDAGNNKDKTHRKYLYFL